MTWEDSSSPISYVKLFNRAPGLQSIFVLKDFNSKLGKMVFPLDSLFALIYTGDIDLIKVPMNLVVGRMQISIICMTIPLRGPAHYWGPATFHDLTFMILVHLLAKSI